MSTNMTLITSVTVGSGGAASVTLPATGTIPATYTDLRLMLSVRSNRSATVDGLSLRFNNSTTNYSSVDIYGTGSSVGSQGNGGTTELNFWSVTGNTATSNTFSNVSIYIPNYTAATGKSVSNDGVDENNATSAYMGLDAGYWGDTAAITTIQLFPSIGTAFVEGSTFYLYGISNVTSTTKATGGIVSSDGTYNYHMFPYSGTFTPTQNITADYLVIAGGGGAGGSATGGGGAGGYKTSIGGSPLSLTAQAYTVTIGAGGAGGATGNNQGIAGSNSIFSTITSTGGGRGAIYGETGGNGGSGGGGGGNSGATSAAGTGNAGEGNNGGIGQGTGGTSTRAAGGGGGAGAVGSAAGASNGVGGAGGIGLNTNSTWAIATQTGVSGYYAGGGGGWGGTTGGAGGTGGGGTGPSFTTGTTNGVTNTGGGAGGGGSDSTGGSGGSGLVIIRYAI